MEDGSSTYSGKVPLSRGLCGQRNTWSGGESNSYNRCPIELIGNVRSTLVKCFQWCQMQISCPYETVTENKFIGAKST